jgi:hypothetical protein
MEVEEEAKAGPPSLTDENLPTCKFGQSQASTESVLFNTTNRPLYEKEELE